MMATTHALAGVLLAVAVEAVAPGFGTLPLVAAAVGGALPDLDLAAVHRRTLHFPVYYSVAAAVAAVVALALPAPVTVAAALFLAAAALHSVSDAFGGGLELRPWAGTSERAVYDHYRGRWLPPRRLVRYDGAPEDFLLAAALAVPSVLALSGPAETAVLAAVGVSAVYALLRKPLVDAGEALVAALPQRVLAVLPASLVDDLR
jgi:hypothetical protein